MDIQIDGPNPMYMKDAARDKSRVRLLVEIDGKQTVISDETVSVQEVKAAARSVTMRLCRGQEE